MGVFFFVIMAAPALKYSVGNSASTTLSSSVSAVATTASITATTNFDDAPVSGEGMVLIDEGTATEELAYSTGLAGNNLTIPLANRGLEGGSAQTHNSQATVKGPLTAGMWNDLIVSLKNILDQTTGAIKSNLVFSGIDINGTEAILDADADTSITADTDDQIDFKLGGSDRFRMKTSDFDMVTATGNIQVAGADPKRALRIPASAMYGATTNGAASGQYESSSNKINVKVLDFDGATEEYGWFNIPAPDWWDLGTVTAKFHWTAASGSGDVIWGIAALARSNDDALDTALGTAVTVTDTLIATLDEHVTPTTSAVTIGGTPAKGDNLYFRVYRDADAGGDTLNSVDARLLGVSIYFTQGQLDDQ